MRLLYVMRRKVPNSSLRPDGRVLRTIQAPYHVKDDAGHWRISSAAFSAARADGACSIDLEQLLHADGLASDALYPALDQSVGLAALSISVLQTEALEVQHEPVCTDWYHGGVRGDGLRKKGVTRRLAASCEIVVPIDQKFAAQFHALSIGVEAVS